VITTRTITTIPGDLPVPVVTIDRHARRNALDRAHAVTLAATVRQAPGDGARAIVITGEGSTFCAGADFGEVTTDEFRACLLDLLDTVAACPVPVVAAINGPAIGAGLQLALACDLRVADEGARFALPTARYGFAADPGTVHRLAELIGGSRARAVLLACEEVGLDDALQWGLVHRRGGLPDAEAWAAELAAYAPLSIAFYKQVLGDRGGSVSAPGDGLGSGEPASGRPGRLAQLAHLWRSDDVAEGAAARAERRAPRFTGR
jgi:enoyl-CoA hydratase